MSSVATAKARLREAQGILARGDRLSWSGDAARSYRRRRSEVVSGMAGLAHALEALESAALAAQTHIALAQAEQAVAVVAAASRQRCELPGRGSTVQTAWPPNEAPGLAAPGAGVMPAGFGDKEMP